MGVTSHGFAVFCGVILGGFGALGLLADPHGPWHNDFLLAYWLPPIVLFPGAALAAALGGLPSDKSRDLTHVLWPAYAGLVLYGLGTGSWSNYVSHIPLLIVAVQIAVFLVVGGLLAPFQQTRPASFQIWLACPVLLCCWVTGTFFI
jgi:hypothetical protein